MKYFTLMHDGVYICRLHKVHLNYDTRRMLRRHLYLCHRGDDLDFIIINGLDPHKGEMLCRDCKVTSFEYSFIREDFWRYCTKYDEDGEIWQQFLMLNSYYENTYIQEQFIIGTNLIANIKENVR